MVDLPWLNQGYGGGDYSSLLQAIPSIMYGFHGFSTGPQTGNAQQLGQVANAQMDIDNPLYKKLYGQFRQQGRDALGQGIQELSAQNRKLAANGRVPLLDQERGGEQLWRGLMQGYQNSDNQAGVMAQGALGNAANSLAHAFNANTSLAMQQNQNKYQKTKAQTGVAGLVAHLFGL